MTLVASSLISGCANFELLKNPSVHDSCVSPLNLKIASGVYESNMKCLTSNFVLLGNYTLSTDEQEYFKRAGDYYRSSQEEGIDSCVEFDRIMRSNYYLERLINNQQVELIRRKFEASPYVPTPKPKEELKPAPKLEPSVPPKNKIPRLPEKGFKFV